MDIQHYIQQHQRRIEKVLSRQLKQHPVPGERLQEAMQYAVLNGGKRLRPVLAYASAQALGEQPACADIPACALELVHAYSLIHDDLPAMDDDTLRRGLPTCHIVFDEATAILAGDALQSLAFELLARADALAVGDRIRLRMIALLSQAIGWQGMAAGQSLDFSASGKLLSEQALVDMHGLKTGALIRASVLLGALSTNIAAERELAALEQYADCLGLAFQVQDDILDVSSDTATLGKQQGRDALLNKPTYVSMLGMQGARQKADQLYDESLAALAGFGSSADPLKLLALYVVQRQY